MNTDRIQQNVAGIIDLTADETDRFISILRPKSVERNQILLPEGRVAPDVYFVNSGGLRVYSIDALEDTEVLCISKSDLKQLYLDVPKFERFFRIRHQRAFVHLIRRTMQSISRPAEEKYLAFRERYPGLELRVPQKEIAAYLGITPEYLSVLRRKLARNGSQSLF